MNLEAGGQPVFPPIVWTYLMKLACELPDDEGRSLALWTCSELARTLVLDGLVNAISPQTVQRMLQSSRLKPWRVHHWLSPKVPRDEAFREIVLDLCDLYTRKPVRAERIVSLDECRHRRHRVPFPPATPRPGSRGCRSQEVARLVATG